MRNHRLNRLCQISLLTGKIQGISCLFGVIGGFDHSKAAEFWAFDADFPARGNREFSRKNREFGRVNRDFCSLNLTRD